MLFELACAAIVFWFIILPLLRLAIIACVGTYYIVDGIKNTEVTPEQFEAHKAIVRKAFTER